MKIHVMTVPGEPNRDTNVQMLMDHHDACVHADPSRNGAMWNWASMIACMARDTDSEWHIGLQDDAAPHEGWTEHLPAACRFSPQPMLGLTWRGAVGTRGIRENAPYIVGPYLLLGTAIAYHSSIIEGLAEFAGYAAQTDYKHDDIAANVYSQSILRRQPALVTRPLFATPYWGTFMGHGPVRPARTSIQHPGADYATRRSVRENRYARRADEGVLLNLMRDKGYPL